MHLQQVCVLSRSLPVHFNSVYTTSSRDVNKKKHSLLAWSASLPVFPQAQSCQGSSDECLNPDDDFHISIQFANKHIFRVINLADVELVAVVGVVFWFGLAVTVVAFLAYNHSRNHQGVQSRHLTLDEGSELFMPCKEVVVLTVQHMVYCECDELVFALDNLDFIFDLLLA